MSCLIMKLDIHMVVASKMNKHQLIEQIKIDVYYYASSAFSFEFCFVCTVSEISEFQYWGFELEFISENSHFLL